MKKRALASIRVAGSFRFDMRRQVAVGLLLAVLVAHQPVKAAGEADEQAEPNLNTQMFPPRILSSGTRLNVPYLSANAIQLSENIGLSSVLQRIQSLRAQVATYQGPSTIESLSTKQDLHDAIQQAVVIIQRTGLEVDYVLAEIYTELSVYREWLAACQLKRNKALDTTVAVSGASNLVLWSVCEALTLPVIHTPSYITPSGIMGITAGVIPSIASMYALKASAGKKYTSENDPNMLSKIFGNKVSDDSDYPESVWTFLNQVPAEGKTNRTRRDQLIDRWITDASIPTFTNRDSKRQRDILCASGSHRKSLDIDTLNMRTVMLGQLAGEVQKMKRNLLELAMTIDGSKVFSGTENSGKH